MKLNYKVICLVFPLLQIGSMAQAQMESDNSKINERDRSAKELTADSQKSNESDTNITAQIRKDIMNVKNLSSYAQNVKIITVAGKVTLKGPVRNANEKNQILKFARSVAGATNVTNEMTITKE